MLLCILQELEKELEQEISIKRELEITLRLLEKDAKAKQTSMTAMRKELDSLKLINQDLLSKLTVKNLHWHYNR